MTSWVILVNPRWIQSTQGNRISHCTHGSLCVVVLIQSICEINDTDRIDGNESQLERGKTVQQFIDLDWNVNDPTDCAQLVVVDYSNYPLLILP